MYAGAVVLLYLTVVRVECYLASRISESLEAGQIERPTSVVVVREMVEMMGGKWVGSCENIVGGGEMS